MECEKKSFETKEAAILRVAEIQKEDKGKHRKPLRSYRCDKCGKFHLTSWTKKKKKEVAIKKIINQVSKLEREAEYYIKKNGWGDD